MTRQFEQNNGSDGQVESAIESALQSRIETAQSNLAKLGADLKYFIFPLTGGALLEKLTNVQRDFLRNELFDFGKKLLIVGALLFGVHAIEETRHAIELLRDAEDPHALGEQIRVVWAFISSVTSIGLGGFLTEKTRNPWPRVPEK